MSGNEDRYRLRIDNKIVGYMRKMGRLDFYSPDAYAWSGKEIAYNKRDKSAGVFDMNRRLLYAEDIFQVSTHPQLYFILHFDEALNTFQWIEMETSAIFEPNALSGFEKQQWIKHVSYTFIQHV